jgi:hypothetical protein
MWSVVQHLTKKERELTFGHLQHSTQKDAPKAQCSKGKGKRSREDDVPPAPTPQMAEHDGHLQELKQHVFCQSHSKPGQLTYCAIDKSGVYGRGGHDPLTHKDLTYWANEIVSRKFE